MRLLHPEPNKPVEKRLQPVQNAARKNQKDILILRNTVK